MRIFVLTGAMGLAMVVAVASARAQAEAPGPGVISITVREGTALGFDLSRDGRTIVFDLLGQLWTLDAAGGEALAITHAVRDTAEDLDPSFSPDGSRVVFTAERGGRRGLWFLDRDADVPPRRLARTPDGDGFDGWGAWSPDGRTVAFARVASRRAGEEVLETSEIYLVDPPETAARALPIEGLPEPEVRDPAWSPDGETIAFVAASATGSTGGRVWAVPATGGTAQPLTGDIPALAPAFSPDGNRIAFLAPDSVGAVQVWVQEIGGEPDAPARRLTDQRDVTPTRVRWTRNADSLLYAADGGLWRVPAAGGPAASVPFEATLSFASRRASLPPVRFPSAGVARSANGHMGLAIAPSGTQLGVIALGKLWIVSLDAPPEQARAVADVPATAHGLAWSADETEVAWAGGRLEFEDLYATDVATGATRRLTALEGGERAPLWSPDGARLAFVHATAEGFRLRVVDARGETVRDLDGTLDLGEVRATWVGETADAPAWSPDSRSLLVWSPRHPLLGTVGEIVFLSGERRRLERFADTPIFLQWTATGTIVFARHDRLWTANFDTLRGVVGEPRPMGASAALYLSAARDGTLLFLSEGGWRLRSPLGEERTLGWPLRYAPPVAEPLLIRNVRVVDGTGAPVTAPSDMWIRDGRIVRIGPAAVDAGPAGVRVLDAGGRIAIPGLMDLHTHTYDPAGLPGRLYYGVTTVRDQGSRVNTLVGMAEAIDAGVVPGPRVSYGGFQYFSDWPFDSEEWRGIEPEADANHVERSVALAEALGAHHIKTRTFRRWDINARLIEAAHRRGMRVTGHCAHPLPLVAEGIDAMEHVGACGGRGDPILYGDLLQLLRAAGIPVVPTAIYWDLTARVNRDGGIVPGAGLDPWEPVTGIEWMLQLDAEDRAGWADKAADTREMVARLHRAGVRLGLGTDVWQVPWGVHLELEELVRAGLTPLEAIHAATGASAEILGAEAELGTLEPGKWADLVILDADPLADIRNTGRIHTVVKAGEIVDRAAIRDLARPTSEAIPEP